MEQERIEKHLIEDKNCYVRDITPELLKSLKRKFKLNVVGASDNIGYVLKVVKK